jgi:hypothetical protein
MVEPYDVQDCGRHHETIRAGLQPLHKTMVHPLDRLLHLKQQLMHPCIKVRKPCTGTSYSMHNLLSCCRDKHELDLESLLCHYILLNTMLPASALQNLQVV